MQTLPASESLVSWMSSLPADERRKLLDDLPDDAARLLPYYWPFYARPSQLPPPGDWRVWMLMAGRGFGKTRAGAEWVIERARSGRYERIALVARISEDVRGVLVEGNAGIMNISPPDFYPVYEPGKRRITWPNGCIATTYTAEEPKQLRGPEHDSAWADEVAQWSDPDAWVQLNIGLRIGTNPQCVVTTTPRPVKVIRDLITLPSTRVTRGTTYENLENLSPMYQEQLIRQYEGTRLGRQELGGELLEDIEGALWQYGWIADHRMPGGLEREYARVVVAIDPAATHGEDADFTGVAVAGLAADGDYYLLSADQYRLSPSGWAQRAIDAYDTHAADRLVAEINNGGDMVVSTISQVRRDVPVKVIHASRGKTLRAEPIALLYEQGRVHHVGLFPALEDQMCAFPVANEHDDLVDAVVYALTELAEGGKKVIRAA